MSAVGAFSNACAEFDAKIGVLVGDIGARGALVGALGDVFSIR